jgi:hypothetical protein
LIRPRLAGFEATGDSRITCPIFNAISTAGGRAFVLRAKHAVMFPADEVGSSN